MIKTTVVTLLVFFALNSFAVGVFDGPKNEWFKVYDGRVGSTQWSWISADDSRPVRIDFHSITDVTDERIKFWFLRTQCEDGTISEYTSYIDSSIYNHNGGKDCAGEVSFGRSVPGWVKGVANEILSDLLPKIPPEMQEDVKE